MFERLSDFYTSQIWRDFRKSIISERTDPSIGFVRDEVTGNPILSDYDIIAHHIQPITTENVNDFDVSLNPTNIQLVSHKTHNQLHKRFGYSNAQRKVYYVYGAPCSGKTSFVDSVKGNSDIVLDIDDIWTCLTHSKKYDKPNALKQNVFVVRDCIYDMIRTRTGKWERAYVIEGGALKSERERKITDLGAEPIFINAPIDACITRLHADETRRAVVADWEQYIHDWFDKYQA